MTRPRGTDSTQLASTPQAPTPFSQTRDLTVIRRATSTPSPVRKSIELDSPYTKSPVPLTQKSDAFSRTLSTLHVFMYRVANVYNTFYKLFVPLSGFSSFIIVVIILSGIRRECEEWRGERACRVRDPVRPKYTGVGRPREIFAKKSAI